MVLIEQVARYSDCRHCRLPDIRDENVSMLEPHSRVDLSGRK